METCHNCGRMIGKLEQPQLFNGHVICFECKERLNAQSCVAPFDRAKSLIKSLNLTPEEKLYVREQGNRCVDLIGEEVAEDVGERIVRPMCFPAIFAYCLAAAEEFAKRFDAKLGGDHSRD